MAKSPRIKFAPGDFVFVRWQGGAEFEIVEIIRTGTFPRYLCKTWGGRKYDFWEIPQIHMAKKQLTLVLDDGNRKQLSLFNAFFTED